MDVLAAFPNRFECPLCGPEGIIEAINEHAFKAQLALHIGQHETRAALRAVEKARLGCGEPDCAIGRTTVWNLKEGKSEPRLTAFDKDWFSGAGISWPQ